MTHITLPTGIASYPFLDQPRKSDFNPDAKPQYSTDIIFNSLEELSELESLINKLVSETFGKTPKNFKHPIKNGTGKENSKGELQQEYQNKVFITVKSTEKPEIVDACVEAISGSEIYGGCHIKTSVNVVPYDVRGNKGVSLYLNAVQKIKGGDKFGSSSTPQAKSVFKVEEQ